MDCTYRCITSFITWMQSAYPYIQHQMSKLTQAVSAVARATFCKMDLEHEVLDLQKRLVNSNPHHSLLSLTQAKQKGFLPDKKIECAGAVYYLSRPHDLAGNCALFALVEVNGQVYSRNFYFSRSQGIWRVLPEVVKLQKDDSTRELGHFGKGIGEVDTNLPFELQSALSSYVQKDVVCATLDEEAVNVVHTAQFVLARYSSDYSREVSRLPGYLDAGPYTLQPKFSEIQEADRPDFSTCIQHYPVWSPLYGDMMGYVYHSVDKRSSYLIYEIVDFSTSTEKVEKKICEKMQGLAFMAGYEVMADNPITSYGNRKFFHKYEFLDLPLLEYRKQIPRIGKMVTELICIGMYSPAWNVIRENPYIQQFYASRGKSVPQPL